MIDKNVELQDGMLVRFKTQYDETPQCVLRPKQDYWENNAWARHDCINNDQINVGSNAFYRQHLTILALPGDWYVEESVVIEGTDWVRGAGDVWEAIKSGGNMGVSDDYFRKLFTNAVDRIEKRVVITKPYEAPKPKVKEIVLDVKLKTSIFDNTQLYVDAYIPKSDNLEGEGDYELVLRRKAK